VPEEIVHFRSGSLHLEGLLEEQPGHAAVVFAAPHPLYGCTMDDDIIQAMRAPYREGGYSTLRFNYRGVGRSEGIPDDDAGSQEDLASAIAYLAGRGKKTLDVVGYSFGAWLAFRAVQSVDLAGRGILIAPPVSFIRFSGTGAKIRLVVAGAKDHFASPRSLKKHISRCSPHARLVFIPDANHYFMLKIDELVAILQEFLAHGQ
jgi:uncharacterized protein